MDLETGDRLVDMARDGIDIAIRVVPNLPDTVVARRIGTLGRALYAAPAYVEKHELPTRVDELAAHTLVTNTAVTTLNDWPFIVDGQPVTFRAAGRWRANDTSMAAGMVLQGLGIGRITTLVADGLVRQKLLVPVLADCVDLLPMPVYAVTDRTRHRLPKIKACLDYWTEWFAREGR